MLQNHKQNDEKVMTFLWAASGILLLALLFGRAIFPEFLALSILICVLLLGCLGMLVYKNQKALRSRTAAYGLNSLVTVLLVFGIVGVVNFLMSRYPMKLDTTKNKIHTLSDQTSKLLKDLKNPVKAVYYSKVQQKEQLRTLLENYRSVSPKFEVEYVDPDKEPTRAKQADIKKYGTLHLVVGPRENRIEDPSEEKITNALIKLLKDKSPTLCAVTGHGEKSFSSEQADGYQMAKKALHNQSYEVKEVSILQETKVPAECDALVILGPTKGLFTPEVKIIQDYLNGGGRAIVALDINLKGPEFAPEWVSILGEWHVKPHTALIVDPLSRMLNMDASVALLASYSKESPITKEFQQNCVFPFSRPLEVMPNPPAGMHVQWIAQSTPKSWGVTQLADLGKGEVSFTPGKDEAGPLSVAVAVEGKKPGSPATKNTRLVVFGTSIFASNHFQGSGGNLDLFLNSISWTLEDESLISIHTKEEGPGKVELSLKTGRFIFLLTIVLIPLLTAVSGLVIWIRRRKL